MKRRTVKGEARCGICKEYYFYKAILEGDEPDDYFEESACDRCYEEYWEDKENI